ncbi:MAG: Ig-like domain-containing protein, partial [Patescibacteria group bacterium]
MTEILSAHHHKKNVFRSLWYQYSKLDITLKIGFVTYILLIISTPFIVLNHQIFGSKAQIQERPQIVEESNSSIGSSNTSLLQLNEKHLKAKTAEEKSPILQEMEQASLDRKSRMLGLMIKDPKKANELALSESERLSLPKEIQDRIERKVEVEGEIEVLHQDDFENGKSRFEYFLRTPDRRDYSLFLSDTSVPLVSQAKVRVKGIALDQNLAAAPAEDGGVVALSDPVAESIAESLVAPPITKNIAVILVNFQDDTSQPWTISEVNDVIFNQADAYYNENSFGKLRLTGDIFGYYTLPFNKTCGVEIQTEAIKIADPDVFFPNYTNIIIPILGCKSGGSIGNVAYFTQEGRVTPGFALLGSLNNFTVSHELGHNFGNFHANFYDCGNSAFAQTGCISKEYEDRFDVMGGIGNVISNTGHFNSYHKEITGFFDSSNVVNVTESGSYTINPIESATGLPQVLKIGIDNSKLLYIEYRQPLGVDSFLPSDTLDGAMIRIAPWRIGNGETQLLDMTPTSPSSPLDVTLEVGKSFTYDGFATVTTVGQTPSSLTVDVRLVNAPTPTPTPTPVVSTPTPTPTPTSTPTPTPTPDIIPPIASITSPIDGSTVAGTVMISADASDNIDVTKVHGLSNAYAGVN